MKKILLPFLLASVVATQLVSCFNEPFDQAAMLQSLGSDVIIPTYAAFAEQSGLLVNSADAFCADPTTSGLGALQAQWQNARALWKQTGTINFGPYMEQPWRLGPKLDSWPVREDTIEENLASGEPLTFETVRNLGASSRGLPAMEYLIFDPEGSGAALSKFEDAGGDRRCDYTIALAKDVQANADAMVRAWSPSGDDYLGALLASGEPGAPFMSIRDASNEIVNRMLFLVENAMRLKLGQPLGLESGGEPRPELVESRYSDNSLQDILANLDGLENIYRGRFGDRHGTGVQLWVRWHNPEVDHDVLTAILETRWAIEAIPEPLSQSVVTQADLVQAGYDQMRELRNTIGIDLINTISGNVTFNDTDGD